MKKKKKTDSQRRSEAFARWEAERKAPAPTEPITDSAENEPEETDGTLPDEPGDEQCQDIFQKVENAPLRKPLGKWVTEIAPDGIHWRL